MPNFIMRINSKPRQQTQPQPQPQPQPQAQPQPQQIQRQQIQILQQQILRLGSTGRRNCAALQFKGSKTCGSCGKR